jgi:hypothetical protein
MVRQQTCRRRVNTLGASGVPLRAEDETPPLTLPTPVWTPGSDRDVMRHHDSQ